jgi:hypothetical protein
VTGVLLPTPQAPPVSKTCLYFSFFPQLALPHLFTGILDEHVTLSNDHHVARRGATGDSFEVNRKHEAHCPRGMK